ncbi:MULTISPECIES: FAD-dependent oxidoreductase [unclassified Mesorhizobium]|uniref:NAD(P)/FAD-dependent oxidoreductase n=1 Tax=unclassified Mesorhizobium TaxID=325217 RepID=UPI00095BC2BE|nr:MULTISPECIES: FAD-dependent oxidoreductase [unclassified Mesorhizobium]MBN9254975.1 FAD-binding oxidoreductase [Mesorhizobium sp.]MBN9271697.1 FAD-binding oxidoreductase [Mesorhizobium sp.]OJX76108.1 MAG: hypothetical protein BGO93_29390 [Mesorhizobium sp. 65-26]
MTTTEQVDALVLGAGIVGLSTALHLVMRGRSTVVVDLNGIAAGASFGNLGFVETSSIFPYAFPRKLGEMARYALNQSPAARFRWSSLPLIAPTLARYWWHSGSRRYDRLARTLAPLMLGSAEEHFLLAREARLEHLYRPGGWLTIVSGARQHETAQAEIERLRPFGVAPRYLDRKAVLALEPMLGGDFTGAMHWKDAWTSSDPRGVVLGLARRFEALGGRILRGDARAIRQAGERWTLDTETVRLSARDAIVALGSAAKMLVDQFGYRIPLAEKRGYHQMFAYPEGERLRLPVGNPGGGWAVVPLANGLRLGTGVEFAAAGAAPSYVQIDMGEANARGFVELGDRLTEKPWMGTRPFMPDMLPVIGPAPRHRGLWFGFGHAHHGFTLGPVTGRLLTEWICDGAASIDIAALSPRRFGA